MVLFSIIQTSFAQTKEGQSLEPARKATFINNGFWDHWFIGAGAGANIYFGDRNSDADFFHRFTVAPEIQFGLQRHVAICRKICSQSRPANQSCPRYC